MDVPLCDGFKDNGLEVLAAAVSTACQAHDPDADHKNILA